MRYVVCLVLLVSTSVRAGVIARICTKIFGGKDASVQYQDIMRQALRDHAVQDPEKIGVKQMNEVADRLLGQQLAAFSFFGNTWISEARLNGCSPIDKKYNIYHEAAHHALGHHKKAVAKLGAIAVLTVPIAYGATQWFVATRNAYVDCMLKVAALIAYVHCFGKYAVRPTSRAMEKEADVLAAQTFIKTGQVNIVAKYVQRLKKQVRADVVENDPWHKPIEEQIAYLSEVLIACQNIQAPQSGTHVKSTGEVGHVTLKRDKPGKGKERIEIRLVNP